MSVKRIPKYWQTFFLALGLAALIFIPYIIYNNGYFLLYGDFNVQQIPFYKLAHEAIRSGDLWWNWYTDLGANFVGSYSFYLLFSPFFWLTLLFPTSFLPHLMGPLLILKFACAAFTSYFYIAKFVKNKNYALIGGLLYAFSGFCLFNVFFNHFHEVVVFFPLLLIAMEDLVQENRRGFFAVAVAINAMVNYWFFIGEVVFVLIYFFVRCTDPDFKMNIKTFLWMGFEAVLGVMIASVVLIPSALTVMGNPRTTSDNLLFGWRFWLYSHEQRQPAIIQSLLFMPELPSNPNMLPDHGAKWASLSAYLPLISMTGVLSFIFWAKNNWLKKMLITSFVIAMIPGFNAVFIMFNNSYYARWFYMPILMMCVATVIALENKEISLNRGFKWTAVGTLAFIVAIGLTPDYADDEWKIGLAKYADRFWLYAGMAILALVAVYLLIRFARKKTTFPSVVTLALSVFIVASSITFIGIGKNYYKLDKNLIDTAIEGREKISLPQEPFARVDIYDGMENLGMFWHLPNLQAFHSVVPVSIMEFYPSVGVKRDVSSKPETKYYALRPLLSVKWLFIEEDEENQTPMSGYTYFDNQNGFNIYENDNFLPFGFAYDYYVDRQDYEEYIAVDDRSSVMLKAIVLEEEAEARHEDILDELDAEFYTQTSEYEMELDVEQRRTQSSYYFQKDNTGFTSKINLTKENLVFFSVPYEKGWTATVNGNPVPVEKANVGFMAVRAPAGDNEIRFNYETPGLKIGAICAGAGIVILVVYLLIFRFAGKKPKRPSGQAPTVLPVMEGELESANTFQERITSGNEPPAPDSVPTPQPEKPADFLNSYLPDETDGSK